MVSGCVAWIQLNGSAEFLPASVQIPVKAIQDECQRGVCFTEGAVRLESFDRRRLGFRERFSGAHHGVLPVSQQGIGIGQTGVRRCVVWILLNGLVKISNGALQTICSPLIPEISTLEIRFVGLRINGLLVLQQSLFLRIQTDTDLISNGVSYLTLKRQDISYVPFIALGP